MVAKSLEQLCNGLQNERIMEERRYSTSVLTDSEKLNMKKKQRRKGRERKHFHVFCKPDRDILTSLMLDSYK